MRAGGAGRFRALDCAMPGAGSPADGSSAREVAARMAEAASAWLDDLDPEQRRVATGAVPGDDPADVERRSWFYTPTDHGGLTFHAQRPAQQRAAMRLVASGVSPPAHAEGAAGIGLGDGAG